MSLRDLPSGEKTSTTLGLLALAVAMGLGLVSIFMQELRPAPPASGPPARSRLVAVLEGVMAGHVTPGETNRFRTWAAEGATREGYAKVAAVVANNCAGCHYAGGQYPRLASFEDLRPIALDPAPSGLWELVSPRTLHLMGFPLILLVAWAAYLRRLGTGRQRPLLGASVLAGLGDALQSRLLQGRPEAHWATWIAATLLAGVMAWLVTEVLVEIWRPRRG